MDSKEIKEAFESQFKILSKRLECELDSCAICKISKEMRRIAEELIDLDDRGYW